MGLPVIVRVISSLCLIIKVALALSLSKPGCQEKCGNVTIPYPFGMGSECSANSSFNVICRNSRNPPTPFLSSINMEALSIPAPGIVIVKQPVSPLNCSDVAKTISLATSLVGSPFVISARYNTMAVLGCQNSVWLRDDGTYGINGCMVICEHNSTDKSCSGINCCLATVPSGLQELHYTYETLGAGINNSFCGYAFPVEREWFQEDYTRYKGLHDNPLNPFDQEFKSAPLVLEWELNDLESSDSIYCGDSSVNYHSFSVNGYRYMSSSNSCYCLEGYEGNPYLPGGCSDIDECIIKATLVDSNLYCVGGTCINTKGSYTCQYPVNQYYYFRDENDGFRAKIKIASITIGSVIGSLILLICAWKSSKVIINRIKASRKHKFFKQNGGLFLEQRLSAAENGLEKPKLFSSTELAQATDDYNENRILGRGGQGTVYKGMLADGRIVAVKKSKKVDQGDLEVFINEVVILSKINHRNVVKLLGCCLEAEVPLLVYEFIQNGTLFQHIHDPSEEFPLSWEMRTRIAREVAGALAYLHSAASAPIYHRDIKSTNILLDDKYRAKVSDFGTSRSIAIDQTHLTTRVLGTFGYLDPEYFQSSQFTEKSDVYSFGVVMVELLTGEKAISTIRVEEGRSLATHFLHSMEENKLLDILDVRVVEEGSMEEIVAIAELARRCLHLNGRRRPTMKEVTVELEGIQMLRRGSSFLQNQDDSRECNSIEVDESDDFSSISGSLHLDTITPYSPEAEHPFLDEP